MDVTKTVSANGNEQDKLKKGNEITIKYISYLYDTSKATNNYRGNK
jgi:hypothetical protein